MSKVVRICGVGNIGHTLTMADLSFDATIWIQDINKPLFILHAEDDRKVSFGLGGYQLFQVCSNSVPNTTLNKVNQTLRSKGHCCGFSFSV